MRKRTMLALQARLNSQGLVELVGIMEVVTATLMMIAKRQEMRSPRMTVEVKIVHRKMKWT